MHENAGNIGMRLPYYKFVIENLGVNILSMAYRGYSYSDKARVDEAGLKLDGDAINSFIENPSDEFVALKINRQLVFLQGRSLGGAVAAYMAQ